MDDQSFFLAFTRDILAPAGYKVETASSGPEALEMARSSLPDAILMDVEMPGMDGYETCRRLKADSTTAGIPVVFLTATLDPQLEQRALDAGGVAAFRKAFSQDRLQGVLRAGLTVALMPVLAADSAPTQDLGRDE